MKIGLLIVTSDTGTAAFVGLQKSNLIPKEVRSREFYKKQNLSVLAYLIDNEDARANLVNYVGLVAQEYDGLILLVESPAQNLRSQFDNILFTCEYSPIEAQKNINNHFRSVLSRVYKAFEYFFLKFCEEKSRKLLILPLRNFVSDEIKQLRELFAGDKTQGEFKRNLERVVFRLRARQMPKRESTYSTTYIVDDLGRHFEYGKERHSRVETRRPPHWETCTLSSRFRFGGRYDEERHFNVSVAEGAISGTFAGCHDYQTEFDDRTHINMFPNDFCP